MYEDGHPHEVNCEYFPKTKTDTPVDSENFPKNQKRFVHPLSQFKTDEAGAGTALACTPHQQSHRPLADGHKSIYSRSQSQDDSHSSNAISEHVRDLQTAIVDTVKDWLYTDRQLIPTRTDLRISGQHGEHRWMGQNFGTIEMELNLWVCCKLPPASYC